MILFTVSDSSYEHTYEKIQQVSIPVLFYLFHLRLTDFEFLIFMVALLNKKIAKVQFTENIVFYVNFHISRFFPHFILNV